VVSFYNAEKKLPFAIRLDMKLRNHDEFINIVDIKMHDGRALNYKLINFPLFCVERIKDVLNQHFNKEI